MKKAILTAAVAGMIATGPAGATELVYTPANPSFGGNPLNGSYFLSNAQSQNGFKDPSATSRFSNDPLQNFQESLNRQVLSEIANRIVKESFGDISSGNLTGGHYQFGSYSIDVENGGSNSFTVSIRDTATGKTTQIEMPIYGALGGSAP